MTKAMQQDIRKKRTILFAMAGLGLLVCLYGAALGFKGREFSDKIDLFWGFSFCGLLIYWVACDARLKGLGSPYTKGFLLYLFFPFIVPAYLLKTRGWKGVLLFAGFLLVLLLPLLIWPLAYALSPFSAAAG
jgi:hypothetical protein